MNTDTDNELLPTKEDESYDEDDEDYLDDEKVRKPKGKKLRRFRYSDK